MNAIDLESEQRRATCARCHCAHIIFFSILIALKCSIGAVKMENSSSEFKKRAISVRCFVLYTRLQLFILCDLVVFHINFLFAYNTVNFPFCVANLHSQFKAMFLPNVFM